MKFVDSFADLHAWYNPRRKRFWVLALLILYTVAGFFAAPRVIQKVLPQLSQNYLQRDAHVAEVRFNPWTLRLQANDFEIMDHEDQFLAGFDELVVNLQLRSLFQFALVFHEVSLTGPEIKVTRYEFGESNIGRLLEDLQASGEADSAPEQTDTEGGIRVVVDNLSIVDGALDLNDQMPGTPFNTRLEPIDISVTNFNTLPDRTGAQQVTVTTETGTDLRWNGYLRINPLLSSGKIVLSGSPMPLLYRYFKDRVGFRAEDCCLDIKLNYYVAATPDGGIEAHVENLGISSRDIKLTALDSEETLLELDELKVTNGELKWPEQTVRIKEILFDKPKARLWLTPDGKLNLDSLIRPEPAESQSEPPQEKETEAAASNSTADGETQTTPEAAGAEPDWDIGLAVLRVTGLELDFEDRSLASTGSINLSGVELQVGEISNKPDTVSPFAVRAKTGDEGRIKAGGQLTLLPAPIVDATLSIENVPVTLAQPWLAQVAMVDIASGSLFVSGELSSGPEEQLDLLTDIKLAELLVNDQRENKPLIGWHTLSFQRTHLLLDAGTVDISEIALDQPFARLVIAADGTTNFDALANPDSAEAGSQKQAGGEQDPTEPIALKVGKTTVRNGSMDFTDFSLPLPFAAPISELNGGLSALASNSRQASEINLEGKIGQYGFVDIGGTASLMEPTKQTSVQTVFRNVDMPYLSPYTAEFAGRKIASGTLDLDLLYAFDEQEMNGENKITIREFKLGDPLESPNAMDLPLDLAVALLTDVNGVIDLQLDISGNVDDPEFSASGIVLKAFANLITKAAAAPFKLLGGLIPGGAEAEFDAVVFQPGRTDLMPPERQKLEQLAQALTMRPNLMLQVPAGYSLEADTRALQEIAVTSQVDELTGDTEGVAEEMLTKRTRKALEKLARKQLPELSIREVRNSFKQKPPDGGWPELDEVAYSKELRDRLEAAQSIDEARLVALAETRRASILTELSTDGSLQPAQLEMRDAGEYPLTDNGWVRIELGLETGSGKSAPAPAEDPPADSS